ncbi:MAG: hypothetical protein R3255_00310 [Candidatus Lokiarchaeia archaeon]|nr:hypothetical protein [Candidatus Lokiarchaeia archaeon]
MRKIELFDIALILFIVTVAGLVLYAVIYIIFGAFTPFSGFGYIGRTEAEILGWDPLLHYAINNAVRTLGFTDLTVAVFALFILLIPFRKKEKWAWILTLVVVLIFTLPLLILNTLRIGFTLIILIIFLAIQIVALGITFKEFFKKE